MSLSPVNFFLSSTKLKGVGLPFAQRCGCSCTVRTSKVKIGVKLRHRKYGTVKEKDMLQRCVKHEETSEIFIAADPCCRFDKLSVWIFRQGSSLTSYPLAL